jgi:cell division transport system permease protein
VRSSGLLSFFAEALRGLRANSVVNLLAIGTITMAMLILGFFLLLFTNLQTAMNTVRDRLEISVYLRDGITEPERDYLLSRLRSEPGVTKVSHLSKDQALELFRKQLAGQDALLADLGENPLPESFEVAVDLREDGAERLATMAKRFAALPGVEDVSYGTEGVKAIAGLLAIAKYGGAAVAVLLGVSIVFIISNAVRLALYSRREEIELMQWIGATRGFIRGPFLIEGMLAGVIGTSLAVGLLTGLFHALPREAAALLAGPKGLDFLPLPVVGYLVAAGGVLGLIGAAVSVERFLE